MAWSEAARKAAVEARLRGRKGVFGLARKNETLQQLRERMVMQGKRKLKWNK